MMATANRHYIPGCVWHSVKSWEPMVQFSLVRLRGKEEGGKRTSSSRGYPVGISGDWKKIDKYEIIL
jgi:hypothetical protein